jgi:hypothetical protein
MRARVMSIAKAMTRLVFLRKILEAKNIGSLRYPCKGVVFTIEQKGGER